MATVDILIPTINRLPALVMTLSGIAGQAFTNLRLVVSDQSEEPVKNNPLIQTLRRVITARGGSVAWFDRRPPRGIAEQRYFLLNQAEADYVLYLDDDIWMEPWVVEKLLATLQAEGCAFAGAFPAGLSFLNDIRPEQQVIEYWQGPVQPEAVNPGAPEWERHHLHRAANLYHLGQSLPPGQVRRYKVAWVSACVLYKRAMLEAVGGFSFWSRLPRYHAGEEVLVQNLLMRRWGGFAIAPSGTYHAEMPTTVLNDAGTVDGHALSLLPEMVRRYAPRTRAVVRQPTQAGVS